MTKQSFIILSIISIALLAAGCSKDQTNPIAETPTTNTNTETSPPTETPAETPVAVSDLRAPIEGYASRITAKPFGLKVSPQNSPVSPEKFTGYHAGTDFETTATETDAEIPVYALCTGKLLQKRTASGYGGVLTQACTINNQAVTVIYGHLKLTSVAATVGANLKAGDKLGLLGKGYSAETDNERKHLHLGIHKGTGNSITGYVKTEAGLSDFIDFETLKVAQ